MKHILFTALILFTNPAHAEVDPKVHKLCLEAKDYSGCVKSMTSAPLTEDHSLSPLRNAMKQVAARLRLGTSLRDSTETFRTVVDQLAIVETSHQDTLAVQKAKLASRMFESLQLAWDTRIKAADYSLNKYGGTPIYNCEALRQTVDVYNAIPGAPYVSWSYSKGPLGWTSCKVSNAGLPEVSISKYVVMVLDEGAVSPAEIMAREKALQERKVKSEQERELCALGPWNKYLEENPPLKQWAATNPQAAEAAKTKFLADPKKQGCSLDKMYGVDMNYNFFSF